MTVFDLSNVSGALIGLCNFIIDAFTAAALLLTKRLCRVDALLRQLRPCSKK